MMSNDENNEYQGEDEPSLTAPEESTPEIDDLDSTTESGPALELQGNPEFVISPEKPEKETGITLEDEDLPAIADFDAREEADASEKTSVGSEVVISLEEPEDEEQGITLEDEEIPAVADLDAGEETDAAEELSVESTVAISLEESADEEQGITLEDEDLPVEDDQDAREEAEAAEELSDEAVVAISLEEGMKEEATEEEESGAAEAPALDSAPEEDVITAGRDELKPVIEALLFVAEDPLPFKQICRLLGDVPEEDVEAALNELVKDYDVREGGLEIREIAGGWRISTRPQYHEFIRQYLKSRPSARLSLPALETLAVIAYKQPITAPEILEIRGVTSSSAIKTLLEKRLIVTRGRKETVGRPMLYGTSKEFLIHFGLKDLSELPSIEDFEDLAQ
jgi:segregation and condensation protein B